MGAQAGLQQHASEAALWCRMTVTKKLSDVHAKVQRLANYIELEDHDAERLCAALETAMASPNLDAIPKESDKQHEPGVVEKIKAAPTKTTAPQTEVHAERR